MKKNRIILKAIGIWLLIVVVAIVNGIFREKLLVPMIGAEIALPLSGVLLASMVFLISLMSVRFFYSSKIKTYFLIGFVWVMLTLSFEFLFGHFILGRSWEEILKVFDIQKGDLFIIVLFITGISPWIAAKVRGIKTE